MGIGVLSDAPAKPSAVVDRTSIPGFGHCESRRTSAMSAVAAGDYDTAVQLLRANLDWCGTCLTGNPVDQMTVWHQEELGKALMRLNRYGEAFIHLKDAHAVRTAMEPEGDRTLETMRNYAFISGKLGKASTALTVYNHLLGTQQKKYGHMDSRTRATMDEYEHFVTLFREGGRAPKQQGLGNEIPQAAPSKIESHAAKLNLPATSSLATGNKDKRLSLWEMTKDQRKRYDDLFRVWDTSKKGYISGDEAVNIFSRSKLKESDLHHIWDLADRGNKGRLDPDEFAVAMHLIYRKLNGSSLPNRLPPELEPPSARCTSESTSTLKLPLEGHRQRARSLTPTISTDNLSSDSTTLLAPNNLSGTTKRQTRSSSDLRPGPTSKASGVEIRRPVSSERHNGRMCDGTLATTEEGDLSVDRWFAEMHEINERIFAAFRRQDARRVKVSILDTGIDTRNVAFQDHNVRQRIRGWVDFIDTARSEVDTCGHGTHCAALINRVAPAADLYIARVARNFESGLDEEVVARAIRKALGPKNEGNWDVDVLSLSFGFPRFSEAINTALDETLRSGKLVLAAASNNGTRRGVAYPASRSGVITIHAASADGKPCQFNPYPELGNSLSILGKNVEAAWTCHPEPTNSAVVRRMTGTSVATPIAAGVVALLLEMGMLDPGNPATKMTVRKMLPMLKTYDGMMAVLMGMAVRTQGGDYHNIVPWNVLDPSKSLADIAKYIADWIFNRRFGL